MNYTRREAYGSDRNLLMETLRQPCHAFATPITGGGSGACGEQGVREDDFHQVKKYAGEGGCKNIAAQLILGWRKFVFCVPFFWRYLA
jgi:hypothetical protein